MNEELVKHLIPLVDMTKEGILKAIDVAQTQVPDLIKQLFAWEIAVAWMGIIGSILGLGVMLYIGWRIYKNTEDSFAFHSALIISIVPICIIGSEIAKLVKIYVAPKLWLMQYIMGLLRK
jgi:hypothetical protein